MKKQCINIKEKMHIDKKVNLEKNKKQHGITLIALVVTIIVLMILASISLNAVFGEHGLVARAKESKFKTRMVALKEEANLYKASYLMEKHTIDETKSEETINSGQTLAKILREGRIVLGTLTEEDVNINIKDILSDVTTEEEKYVVVYKGVLHYVSDKKTPNNENQKKWCIEVNIPILEPDPSSGDDDGGSGGNSPGNSEEAYVLVNGEYMNIPNTEAKAGKGFNPYTTRYLNPSEDGNTLTPGKFIIDDPDSNWYSYKDKKWANLYTEYNGVEMYYVWIPRYAYKINGTDVDVKFLSVGNNYISPEGDKYTLEELGEGYQVPEAFSWDSDGDNTKDTELAGYWMMKYVAGDIDVSKKDATGVTINYKLSVNGKTATLSDFELNTAKGSNTITKYILTVNANTKNPAKIINSSTLPERIDNIELQDGENYITLLGLNANGELVGSMTQMYALNSSNPPQLKKTNGEYAFNPDTTFYVTYDTATDGSVIEGSEHSTIPITEPAPTDWYNYDNKQWANIVTRNDGTEIYYVWIPRYEYTLGTGQTTIVKFIQGTKGKTTGQIPEAFSWDSDGDGKKDTELTGYWMMKYVANDKTETPLPYSASLTTTDSSIKVSAITGASSGEVYNYYINGKKVASNTTGAETELQYEDGNNTKLKANKKYTVQVEVRSSSGTYKGSVCNSTTIIPPNEPQLKTTSGQWAFNENLTYYVTFDANDNPVYGNKISGQAPDNWYSYSEKKWANIVVKDEVGDDMIYYVWIPRYQYKINTTTQTTDVSFIYGTGTDLIDETYKIPEAFSWDSDGNGTKDTELKGYWMMKYVVNDDCLPLIPTMTSNTAPSGKAIASSTYGSYNIQPYRIFDGSTGGEDYWNPGAGVAYKDQYVGYSFTKPVWAQEIYVGTSNGKQRCYFILEATNDINDKNSWVAISDEFYQGSATKYTNKKEYGTKYQHYRIRVTRTTGDTNQNGSGNTVVSVMQIYGK